MKKTSLAFFSLALTLMFSISPASANMLTAVVLVSWDTLGLAGNEATFTAQTIDSDLLTGGGLNTLSRTGLNASAAANTFNSSQWNNTNTFNASNKYLSFVVQPDAGFEMTLTSLQYAIAGSNTAPGTGRWGYSVGGGSFVSGSNFTLFNVANPALATWTFDSAIVTTESVEFRFWGYGAVAVNGGTAASGGMIRIGNNSGGNDLVLNGSVAAVPEPATYLFIGIGAIGLGVIYRRSTRLRA